MCGSEISRRGCDAEILMENLFAAKTGLGAHELNCQEMALTLDDLSTLERLIANVDLPHCDGGFFYGHQFQDEAAAEYADHDGREA